MRRPAFWVVFALFSLASAFLAVRYFPQAFSIVALDITMDREQALARACVAKGPRLAVCTLGADGALAVDATGLTARAPAPSVERVVDTNGAGDAFMAGFLAARLRGLAIDQCLRDGSSQAAVALSTRHLHPSVAPSDG